nr:MAG TPA: hypothetical protein [Caudoviricetes sp.]
MSRSINSTRAAISVIPSSIVLVRAGILSIGSKKRRKSASSSLVVSPMAA